MFLWCFGLTFAGHAQIRWSGQVQSAASASTLPEYSFLDAYNWARLSASSDLSSGKWSLSVDLLQPYLQRRDSAMIRIPQAYIDWYTDKADIRIGQQYISWSRADLAIVSDILSPVDLSRFLTRDFELVKEGLTAVNYTRYMGSDFLQLVINPVFRSNRLPDPDSRWFPNRIFPENLPIRFEGPDDPVSLYDMQFAARYGWRSNLNIDVDLGLLWWHQPTPSYHKEIELQNVGPVMVPTGLQFTETYPQSWMALASSTMRWLDPYILKAEVFYQHKRSYDILPGNVSPSDLGTITPTLLAQFAQYFQQNNGGLLTEKPALTWMMGVQRTIQDWTLSGQFIQERILNYDEQIIQTKHFDYLTLLVQRSFMRDKLQLLFQGRYHFLHGDFWLNPSLTYELMDNLNLEAGGHLFGGGETPIVYGHLSFFDYRSNSLGYLRMSWYF